MRYFLRYPDLQNAMRGKLLIERGWACACIQHGDDFVFTYSGEEAVRQRPDDSMLITLPRSGGITWKKNYGFLYRQHSVRHVPWRGGLEAHRRVVTLKHSPNRYFRNRGEALDFINNKDNHIVLLTTGKIVSTFIAGPVDRFAAAVPKESVPRLKLLTDEGKYQFKHRIAETAAFLSKEKTLQVLRGDAPPPDTYGWWQMAPCNSRFTEIFVNGKVDRTSSYYPEFLRRFSDDDMKVIISKNKWWFAERWNLPVTYEEV